MAMYFSWHFVGPSGQIIDTGTFIALWFRELLFFGFLGGVLLVCYLSWLFRLLHRVLTRCEK